MILNIHHTTRYSFDEKVFLEPHYLKFTPVAKPYYSLESLAIDVQPTPSGFVERTGLEGTIFYQVWFDEKVEFLEIKADLKLKVWKFNPFEFYIDIRPNSKPNDYYKSFEKEALQQCLQCIDLSAELLAWANNIKEETGDNLITFLSFLNQSIHSEFEHTIREEENIILPNELFLRKVGSCRDLSWLMIQILRHYGFAARFVGGYSFNPELEEGHELHAWVEVYLPGGGWIGLDPSAGIFATETYIPICASYDPEQTKPVTGTYRGTAGSTLKTSVDISVTK